MVDINLDKVHTSPDHNLIYLPPNYGTNLGDTSIINYLYREYGDSIFIINNLKSFIALRKLGPKIFFLPHFFVNMLAVFSLKKRTRSLTIIGNDTVDGRYSLAESISKWKLAIAFKKAGVPSYMINFSFGSVNIDKKILSLAKKAYGLGVQLYVRDSISKEHLLKNEIFSNLTRDLVLVDANKASKKSIQEEDLSVKVLILAPAFHVSNLDEQIDLYERLAHKATLLGYAVILYASMPRGQIFKYNDLDICRIIYKKLTRTKETPNIRIVSKHEEFLAALNPKALVVSSRLHVCLYALISNCTLFAQERQGKFRGIFADLGAEHLVYRNLIDLEVDVEKFLLDPLNKSIIPRPIINENLSALSKKQLDHLA